MFKVRLVKRGPVGHGLLLHIYGLCHCFKHVLCSVSFVRWLVKKVASSAVFIKKKIVPVRLNFANWQFDVSCFGFTNLRWDVSCTDPGFSARSFVMHVLNITPISHMLLKTLIWVKFHHGFTRNVIHSCFGDTELTFVT